MTDSHGDPPAPGQPDVEAGRDAFFAGRDLTVYLTYGGKWAAGSDVPSLLAESGSVEAPYRGLRPFGEQDEALFFGRERAVKSVLKLLSDRLDGSGLLVVSGVSGAGKSSLLRAGVLPTLRREGLASAPSARSWPGLVLSPGAHPLTDLAAGLGEMLRLPASKVKAELDADPARFATLARQAALSIQQKQHVDASQADGADRPRLLLIVDQCEQVFTQCGPEERRTFLTALHSASAKAREAMVVMVLRSDFQGSLAGYRHEDFPEFGQAVQDHYFLQPMNERELRLAITGPAAKAGFRVTDELVQVLLEEMRASAEGDGHGDAAIGAGALPLLSHALDQAWRDRSGPNLELADYERIGGIQHAIAVTAEAAYNDLTPAQKKAARSVFIRLTATGSDGADTAIRVPIADLTAGLNPAQADDVKTVLAKFASHRLLAMGADTVTEGSGTVEISHESLLTAWPLLRDTWLTETHADRITRTRLRTTATEWHQSGDPSYLYRGTLLQEAAATAARTTIDPIRNPPLGPTERDFLNASTRASGHATLRRRAAITGLVALTLAASAFAGVAQYNAVNANHQQAIALSRQLAADSTAQDQSDPRVAGQLATAAWRVSPTSQAKDAMLSAVAGQQRGILPADTGTGGRVLDVAFSPDGKLLATADAEGTARLWNPATRRPVGSPLPADPRDGVGGVAFSPDGKLLATADRDGTARLWNPANGRPVGRPLPANIGRHRGVEDVAFSPDGKLLATADYDGTARLWNPANGQPVGKPLPADPVAVYSVAFSPDGKLLATADYDGTERLWNPANGQPVGKPLSVGTRVSVWDVAFSPDGKLLATADGDGTARLWNPATGQPAGNPVNTGSNDPVSSVAFSPDGKLLATADFEGTTRLWNPANGRSLGSPIKNGGASVSGVAFSPDGKLLATANDDGTARLLDPTTGFGERTPLPADSGGHGTGVSDVAFSPDGKLLATAGSDGMVRLWDPVTGRPVGTPFSVDPGGKGTVLGVRKGAVLGVAFSPDGKLLATADRDSTARLWSLETGRPASKPLPADFGRFPLGVQSVAFSPDGKLLATAGSDGMVRLWDPPTGRSVDKTLPADPGPGGEVLDVAFSPDGKLLATADNDGSARLWDPTNGQPVGKPLPASSSTGLSGVAFSRDGTLLATAGGDGTAQLWDPATGERVRALPPAAYFGLNAVAFSPDGSLLAAADNDGTVQLWDPTTGQPEGKPFSADTTGLGLGVNDVAFSPDGNLLATADSDGTARLWGAWLFKNPYQVLCGDFGGITQGQWDQYVGSNEARPKVCS